MSEDISLTRGALNAMMPENCDCAGINGLANELDKAVGRGDITETDATQTFGELIDPDCPGKKYKPVSAEACTSNSCSIPEKVCGHNRGSGFLIAQMMKIRAD